MKNFILSILCLFVLSAQAQTYTPTKANIAARAAFQDSKFGMFIHWGASSVLGDGEWVMNNKEINKESENIIKCNNRISSIVLKYYQEFVKVQVYQFYNHIYNVLIKHYLHYLLYWQIF